MAKPKSLVSDKLLDSFTKEQLYEKWQEEKGKYLDTRNKFEQYQKEMTKKVEEYENALVDFKARQLMYKTEDEVLRKILQLRAENKSPIDIQYKLELYGVSLELEDIKNFIYSELTDEYKEYYDKCKKEWLVKIQMNSKEYRYSVLEELQQQLDRAKEYQQLCLDPEVAHEVGKTIKSYSDSIAKIARDLDDVLPTKEEKDRAEQATEDLLKQSQQVVSLVTDTANIMLSEEEIDEKYAN